MRKINLLFLSLLITHSFFAQMYVHNPQEWWGDTGAKIENVEYEISPAGIYAEVSVAFDLLPEENNWRNQNDVQLEFVWNFNLHENAVFNDSWLWIEDYISYGEIHEKGAGTAIYEGIVERRQDPSILTKYSARSYDLKVYPLFPDSSRRVKLSYLMPMDFDDSSPSIDLGLTELFSHSSAMPENISLKVNDGLNWFHLPVAKHEVTTKFGSGFTEYVLSDGTLLDNWEIEYSSEDPSTKIYFGTYERDNDQYYQLVYYPDITLEREPSYHLVLLDWEQRNGVVHKEQLIETIRKQLKESLNDEDYFSICYSDFAVRFTSNSWSSATDENIDSAIRALMEADIDFNSNLISLLPQSLVFIEENGIKASLDIVSGNGEIDTENNAKVFLEDILKFTNSMEVDFLLNVNDYASLNRRSRWINNTRYSGNEYFYNELTYRYGGKHYSKAFGDDFKIGLENILAADAVVFSEFDLDIEIENGVTYSSYFHNGGSAGLSAEKPIIATGKMIGDFPIEIDLKVVNGNNFISQSQVFATSNLDLDAKASAAWHAEYILENEFSSDARIASDVIAASSKERLLSAKTVFLCLEEDTISIVDEETITSVTDEQDAHILSIKTYPNPFTDILTIELSAAEVSAANSVRIEIYDMAGRLITTLTDELTKDGDVYKLVWTNDGQFQSGIYNLRIALDNKVVNKKLVHLAN